jgi:tetratricopeptide (TPR) repeat protein
MEKSLKRIEVIIIYAIVFLVPITVLPVFINAFVTPKLLVLTWGLALLLVIKAVKILMRRSFKISLGSLDVPVLFLATAYLISALSRTPNKMEAFFLPGTATAILGGALLYFLINQMDWSHKRRLRWPLLATSSVVSIVSLLAISGVFKSISDAPAFMKDPAFAIVEGSLSTFIFLACVLPYGIEMFISERDMAKKALVGTASSIIVLGLVINLFHILPGKSSTPSLPSFQTSWVVAIDSLKESPLIGIGPGNYLSAFNLYRPISYNATPNWAIRFTAARNFYLTLVAETGLLALTGLILLVAKLLESLRHLRRSKDGDELISAHASSLAAFFILAVLLLFFPSSVTLLVFFFVILALLSRTQKTKVDFLLTQKEESSESTGVWLSYLPVYVTSLPLIVFVLLFAYFSGRAVAAEATYYNSLVAVSHNDGKASYDLMRSAIMLNPLVDRYHISYAQLNLTLANSIAAKKDLTDDEKNTVSKLVQQAVREGKSAIVLNPSRSGNWENLGNIYKAIIPLAKGADQFSVQTLQQAVALDPLNPALRISLGGVFYQAKAWDNAIEIFKLAVATKPDYANSHYNLALAYREKGDYEKAIAEINGVIALIDKSGKDYELAKKTLDDLEAKKPAKAETTQSGSTLTPPQQQQNGINPKLELPADANPPQAPANAPTPESSPVSSVAPAATP